MMLYSERATFGVGDDRFGTAVGVDRQNAAVLHPCDDVAVGANEYVLGAVARRVVDAYDGRFDRIARRSGSRRSPAGRAE